MICKDCKDTGEILVYYEDDTGRCLEYETVCKNPIHDTRAYGDKLEDWLP